MFMLQYRTVYLNVVVQNQFQQLTQIIQKQTTDVCHVDYICIWEINRPFLCTPNIQVCR